MYESSKNLDQKALKQRLLYIKVIGIILSAFFYGWAALTCYTADNFFIASFAIFELLLMIVSMLVSFYAYNRTKKYYILSQTKEEVTANKERPKNKLKVIKSLSVGIIAFLVCVVVSIIFFYGEIWDIAFGVISIILGVTILSLCITSSLKVKLI